MMFTLEKANEMPSAIGRRSFLFGSIAGGAVLAWLYTMKDRPLHAEAASAGLPKTVEIVEFTEDGKRSATVRMERIVKSEQEWKKELTPDALEVTRHAATERPGFNEDPNNHERGIFRCVCCDTALFAAETKFASGTGWPSFWAPIAKENVLETVDSSLGMVRTAVSCRLCDAHLGHVFEDGPPPTGLRYCMNSVAMKFVRSVVG
jgi:peptide-methionine (R)-S-oxide reductase